MAGAVQNPEPGELEDEVLSSCRGLIPCLAVPVLRQESLTLQVVALN